MTEPNKWKQIETYLSGIKLWKDSEYESRLKQYKAGKAREEFIKEISGQDIREVNEADYDKELAAAAVLRYCEEETARYIKDNLETLINDSTPKGLIKTISAIPPRSREDTELAKKLEDYELYTIFLSEEPEDEKGKKIKKGATLRILNEKLAELIYNKIKDRFADDEKAKLWATYLAAVAKHDPIYIRENMNPEIIKEIGKIEEGLIRDKNKIADYIKKNLRDEEYLNFGLILYNANRSEA